MAKAIAKFVGKKRLGGVVITGGAELDADNPIVQKYASYFVIEDGEPTKAVKKEKKEEQTLNEDPIEPAKAEKEEESVKEEKKEETVKKKPGRKKKGE